MHNLLHKLAYYFDEPKWYENDNDERSLAQLMATRDRTISSSRLGKAIRTIEEADEIDRDTQDLLRRARIELNKRNRASMMARRAMRGGMFG